MMRVLFDYQAFEVQKIGGVSRSYAELISHLYTKDCSCSVLIKESDNVYLWEKGLVPSLRPFHYHHDRFFGKKKFFVGQRTLTKQLLRLFGYHDACLRFNRDYAVKQIKRRGFDVFEPTYFDPYFLPYLKETPFVMTVHDMIPELYPQYFKRDDFQIVNKRLLCSQAAHIHVPSNKTKEDLISILNVRPEKITVIPHGAPSIEEHTDFGKRLFDFPYLLYVGDRYGYKGFQPWLRQVKRVILDNKELHVICTGKPFSSSEIQLIKDLHLEDNVVHFFADQCSFSSLYHHAVAFVYPSEYEGFGIPILEAFAYKCPVMLNNASCFPEVGGEAAIYFNLRDESSDFYEKFNYLYNLSSEDRLALIEKGTKRLDLYSWDTAAQQLLDVYNKIV